MRPLEKADTPAARFVIAHICVSAVQQSESLIVDKGCVGIMQHTAP